MRKYKGRPLNGRKRWMKAGKRMASNKFEIGDATEKNFALYAYKLSETAPNPSINPVTEKVVRY